jgi:putative flippase GtrA
MSYHIKKIFNFRKSSSARESIAFFSILFHSLIIVGLLMSVWSINAFFEKPNEAINLLKLIAIFCLCLSFFLLFVIIGLKDCQKPGNNPNKLLLSFARWWRKYIMKNKNAEI